MWNRYLSFKILLLIGVFTYIILELNCASRGRPGGGPVDKVAPLIVGTEPRPDSTGLVQLDKIEIFFSERMNESSVQNSIFISPPLEYDTDWSGGDELTLELKDTLDLDRTYVITIGSGAMDMQKNRMADSYQFAFSTGEKLNRGEIYGRVYDITDKDIFYVYGYLMLDPDSLNPTTVKADFLSQPGPDGQFWLKYLPDGDYRIFVIEDQNKNLLLDLALERVGIPVRDVYVDTLNSPVGPLNFRVTRIDTSRPEITGARALDNRTILLRVNEIVNMLHIDDIIIKDTLNQEILPILDLSRNKDEPKQFYLYTALHDSGIGYRIFVPQLEDTSGNYQDRLQIADFTGSTIVDTTRFELRRVEPADSLQNAKLSSTIQLNFSIPVDTSGISEGFICLDKDSSQVVGSWTWKNLMQGQYLQEGGFRPSEQYSYTIKSDFFNSLWGDTLPDSTYSKVFFTLSEDEFGFVSGAYRSKIPENTDIYVYLIPVDRNKTAYQSIIGSHNRAFQFERILEGRYKLSGFIDLDNNGKFSAGNLYPFTFSEPYTITDDTLRVRKRWEISDVGFSIPGLE
jgi:hypothetical protein